MILLILSAWFVIQSFHPETPCMEKSMPGAPEGMILMSADAGNTWKSLDKGLPENLRPFYLWGDDASLYLGTNDGLYTSSTLLPYRTWEKEMLNERSIVGIYPGKQGPFALVEWNGVYQYQPATGQWQDLNLNLNDRLVYSALERNDGTYLVGSESGIYKSTNRGHTWKQVYNKGWSDKLIETKDAILCCVEHGLLRSTDHGDTWELIQLGVKGPFTVQPMGDSYIAITPGQNFGGCNSPNMVFQSKDNGRTWKPMSKSLPVMLSTISDLRQVGDYLVASSNDGIFRSKDNGTTWESILERPVTGGKFYRLCVSGNTMYTLLIEGC